MNKNIFIFDANKCVGCHACTVACMVENGFQFAGNWRNIHTQNKQHLPELPLFHSSLACNHCDDAPCMQNCPALAYSCDEKTGAIIHDPQKCIGCKYCTWACPYDAPKYNLDRGVIEKCTFCNHRISENKPPACANLCPTGALSFANEEFSREESNECNPLPLNVGSHLKVKKIRNVKGPEQDLELIKHQELPLVKSQWEKITALKEWPLLMFSLLVSLLVAVQTSEISFSGMRFEKYVALIGALVAVLFSIFHLGKKIRAWRALINIKGSWLSREIALFMVFFILIVFHTFYFEISAIYFGLVGVLLLFSIDKLYVLATWQWPMRIHSAQTLFIAAALVFLLKTWVVAFVILSIIRISLYVGRGLMMYEKMKWFRVLRILILLFVIFGFIYSINLYLLVAVLLLGELMDRIEFYNELNVVTPQNDLN